MFLRWFCELAGKFGTIWAPGVLFRGVSPIFWPTYWSRRDKRCLAISIGYHRTFFTTKTPKNGQKKSLWTSSTNQNSQSPCLTPLRPPARTRNRRVALNPHLQPSRPTCRSMPVWRPAQDSTTWGVQRPPRRGRTRSTRTRFSTSRWQREGIGSRWMTPSPASTCGKKRRSRR